MTLAFIFSFLFLFSSFTLVYRPFIPSLIFQTFKPSFSHILFHNFNLTSLHYLSPSILTRTSLNPFMFNPLCPHFSARFPPSILFLIINSNISIFKVKQKLRNSKTKSKTKIKKFRN